MDSLTQQPLKHLYLFSGLGADERVFKYLDFSGYQTTFVQWIPTQKAETIEAYAGRLLQQITVEKPILVGVSFGGIIAIEVAKQIATEKIIIISSVKTRVEMPFNQTISALLPIHKIIPSYFLTKSNFLINWFFGVQSKKDKQLLSEILHDTDPAFLKWALDKITRWQNTMQPNNLFHIHGTADRIFPFKFIQNAIAINGGGHFMIVNKSAEVMLKMRAILNEQ